MKKVLLATSALTLLAGVASAAEIGLSGTSRVGFTQYQGSATTRAIETRIRVNFNISGESDSGIGYGAKMRLESANPVSEAEVWLSFGSMTVTAGNTDGAIRNSGGIWGCGVGFQGGIVCGDTGGLLMTAAGFSSTGGANAGRVRVNFALGSANIAVSSGTAATEDNEVAANFAVGAAKVSLGWDQGNNSGTATQNIAVDFDAGSAKIHALYGKIGTASVYNLTASTAVGSGTLSAFTGRAIYTAAQLTLLGFTAADSAALGGTVQNVWGVNYKQSLGGGLNAIIGVERYGSVTSWDAGVTLAF